MGTKSGQGRLAGAGQDFWNVYLIWLWQHVPGADAARSGSLLPLPESRGIRASWVISSWSPSPLPLHRPMCAKQRATGSPKPTTSRVAQG